MYCSQVLARDTRSTTTTITTKGPHYGKENAADGKDEETFVSIKPRSMQPLDFFKVSGDDVASGRVPVDWELCPGMEVVLEMRLEADSSRGGAGAVNGKLSTRSFEVRKQVSDQDCLF